MNNINTWDILTNYYGFLQQANYSFLKSVVTIRQNRVTPLISQNPRQDLGYFERGVTGTVYIRTFQPSLNRDGP